MFIGRQLYKLDKTSNNIYRTDNFINCIHFQNRVEFLVC